MNQRSLSAGLVLLAALGSTSLALAEETPTLRGPTGAGVTPTPEEGAGVSETVFDMPAEHAKSVLDFKMTTIDGAEAPLSTYAGKALLLVNTASECGFTPQYASLEALYEKYKARGFEVLAFPANNFGNQEPGTNAEIKKFCSTTYHTTFPLFAKISVKGDDMHPLYRYLTERPGFSGEIEWNFTKFLVDPKGKVVARFGSRTDPLSKEVTGKLESILPAPAATGTQAVGRGC